MSVLVSALAFFVLLSVLILIHEWGHFSAARFFKVVIEEFGFGLPPKAKTLFKRDGTEFTFNWIPFGGFVRLKGESAMTEKERRAKGSFGAAPVHARIIILLAGVIMNLLLAFVIFTIGFSSGNWVPTYTTLEQMEEAGRSGEIHLVMSVMIDEVISGGNAAKIGVPQKSVLRSIDGEDITSVSSVSQLLEGKSRVTYGISSFTDGKVGEEITKYSVALQDGKSGIVIIPYPLELSAPDRNIATAIGLSFRESKVMMVQTVIGIGKLVSSLARTGTIPEGIAGIVGIAQLTHGAVQEGFMHYLRLVALLSLSLAALNVLPFPALDGGRLIFVLAEWIGRKPINRTFEVATNAVGFVLLLLLILLITFNDIVRLF
ncbi:MAG: M50 family metallopeptidase [Candidatus Peribacteraceae bacterium]|nr:M50 family metallopeptidase [Candidatus Peribacteraceae bacterium]